jgi:hypothetical protein
LVEEWSAEAALREGEEDRSVRLAEGAREAEHLALGAAEER